MPLMRWAFFIATLLHFSGTLTTALCLSDGIPVESRRNLTHPRNNYSGPLLDVKLLWSSAEIVSTVARILLEEKGGYHWAFASPSSSTSSASVLFTAGCRATSTCDPDRPMAHMGLEGWFAATQTYDALAPQHRPIKLSQEHSYSVQYGLFARGDVVRQAYVGKRYLLSYYQGWNYSTFTGVTSSFSNLSNLTTFESTRNILPLKDSLQNWGASTLGVYDRYIEIIGDNGSGCMNLTSGVFSNNRSTCRYDVWIAPACRRRPYSCVPVITTASYLLVQVHQWAGFYDMPLAVLDVSQDDWQVLGHSLNIGFIWWTPDITFSSLNPTNVRFPETNSSDNAMGIFRSDIAGIRLKKYVWKFLDSADNWAGTNILQFLEVMSLENKDFDFIYRVIQKNRTVYNATCTFLQQYPNHWHKWVQPFLMCRHGFGWHVANNTCLRCPAGFTSVMNAAKTNRICFACPGGSYCPQGTVLPLSCPRGTYCLNQSAAPTVCPEGYEQPNQGQLFCTPCANGTAAGDKGMVRCKPCDVGRFSFSNMNSQQPNQSGGLIDCKPCPVGRFADQTKQTGCESCPAGMSTKFWGTDSLAKCMCAAGFLLDASTKQCHLCPQGLNCVRQNANDKPTLKYGFFSNTLTNVNINLTSSSGSFVQVFACMTPQIYQCLPKGNCPGGELGACANHREGLACGLCKNGFYSYLKMPCEKCDDSSMVHIVSAFVGALIASMVFHIVINARSTKRKMTTLLAVSMCGMLFSSVQVLSILVDMPVNWESPVAEVMQRTRFFVVDLEFFEFGCMIGNSPVKHYAMRQSFIPFCLLYIMIAFFLIRLIIQLCKLDALLKGLPALFNSMGVLFLTFFISILRVGTLPFECYDHVSPGLQSVVHYPSTLCGSKAHLHLCVIGALGLVFFPLPFFAHAVWCCAVYEKSVMQANLYFLRSTKYLFERFRGHWCPVFIMVRSLLLTSIPIINDAAANVMLIFVIVSICILVQAWYKPWAIMATNIVDVILSLSLLVFVGCSTLLVEVSNTRIAQRMMLASLLFIILFTAVVFIGAGLIHVRRQRAKPYSVFLCHHKLGSAAFARMLKSSLTAASKNKGVFLDSDNLIDLSTLFDVVRTQIDLHVVLMTQLILTRPWCVGEITIAYLNDVAVMPVIFPEWKEPSVAFVEGIDVVLGEASSEIIRSGMTFDDVRAMLRYLLKMCVGSENTTSVEDSSSCCVLASPPNIASMSEVVTAISTMSADAKKIAASYLAFTPMASAKSGNSAISAPIHLGVSRAIVDGSLRPDFVVLASDGSYESLATAQDFMGRMLRHGGGEHSVAAMVSIKEASVCQICIRHARVVVLLCTYQALDDDKVLASLVFAHEEEIPVLPVVAAPNFEFPSAATCKALSEKLAAKINMKPADVDVGPVVQSAFQRIAINMDMHQSEEQLESAVKMVLRRAIAIRQHLCSPEASTPKYIQKKSSAIWGSAAFTYDRSSPGALDPFSDVDERSSVSEGSGRRTSVISTLILRSLDAKSITTITDDNASLDPAWSRSITQESFSTILAV